MDYRYCASQHKFQDSVVGKIRLRSAIIVAGIIASFGVRQTAAGDDPMIIIIAIAAVLGLLFWLFGRSPRTYYGGPIILSDGTKAAPDNDYDDVYLRMMPTFGNSWAYLAIYWILLIVKELLSGRRTR